MANDQPNGVARGSAEVAEGPEAYRAVESRLLEAIRAFGYPEASVFAVRLAFEEAVMNAFKHGNASGGEHTDNTIDVSWEIDAEEIRLSVADRGPGFDPGSVPDPRDPENLERPTGRGIMLMRAYMTEVAYNDRGNRVDMLYKRPTDTQDAE